MPPKKKPAVPKVRAAPRAAAKKSAKKPIPKKPSAARKPTASKRAATPRSSAEEEAEPPRLRDTAPVADHLAAAGAFLDHSRPEAAVESLLAAWRATRSERIAALIDSISKGVSRPALGGGSLADKHERWIDVATPCDPGDVPRLLATLTSGWSHHAAERVEALGAFADDPRIAVGVANLCNRRPYKGAAMERIISAAQGILEQTADPRTLTTLGSGNEEIANGVRAEVHARFPSATRALDAASTRAAAAIESRLAASRSIDDLLAAVHADPDDDAARAVCADFLQQEGEPWGEVIALQLARANSVAPDKPSRRESKLIEDHHRDWLGALAKFVPIEDAVFEKGFLTRCRVSAPNSRTLLGLADEADWSTVRDITFSGVGAAGLLTSAVFRHLRSAKGLRVDCFEELTQEAPPGLEEIEVYVVGDNFDRFVTALADTPALKRLRRLRVRYSPFSPESLGSAWNGDLFQQLELLEIRASIEELGGWLERAERTSLRSLSLEGAFSANCTREDASSPWTVAVRNRAWTEDDARMLAAALDEIPARLMGSLHIGSTRWRRTVARARRPRVESRVGARPRSKD